MNLEYCGNRLILVVVYTLSEVNVVWSSERLIYYHLIVVVVVRNWLVYTLTPLMLIINNYRLGVLGVRNNWWKFLLLFFHSLQFMYFLDLLEVKSLWILKWLLQLVQVLWMLLFVFNWFRWWIFLKVRCLRYYFFVFRVNELVKISSMAERNVLEINISFTRDL